ncbi:insulinase family protein [Candidatus Gracilibacteria bacterium]|nr:insulinase family protein [Candidatus Gracilibacteria bacterium]
MKIHHRKLANGLRLQAVEMPGTNVVTTLILAGAGSRYEDISIAGISHFLEHMFFKGAKKYPTPKSVAEAVDSFGGEFNAFTGKEYAGYFVKSGQENLSKALDVLSDMLLFSKFDSPEIDRERGVILEEMAMYLDAPMYQISWDFEQLVFGDQPLGRDQIGTKELIKSVTSEQFKQYKNELYVPENMVITVAGAVNEKTLDEVEKFFQFNNQSQNRKSLPFDANITTEKFKIRIKKTEQYHVSLGVRALAETDERFPALKVLATILGGNMSARMFQRIREQKGLCYSIRTQVDEFTDTGLLTTRAGVKLDDVLRAVEAIRHEYDDIIENGITNEELLKAQNYLCGKVDLKTEDTEEVAHHFGKDSLLYNITEDFDSWKNKIRKVTKKEVEALAKELLAPQNLRFAGIGPKVDEEKLLKLIS